jgi:hypothetical protein
MNCARISLSMFIFRLCCRIENESLSFSMHNCLFHFVFFLPPVFISFLIVKKKQRKRKRDILKTKNPISFLSAALHTKNFFSIVLSSEYNVYIIR